MKLFAIVELCDLISEIRIKCAHTYQSAGLCTLDDMLTQPGKDFSRWRKLKSSVLNLEQAVRVRDAWAVWTSSGINPSTVSGFLHSDKLCFLDKIRVDSNEEVKP